MATVTLSRSKALRRPRHLDLRAVLGVLLLLIAVAGSVAFWSASSGTQSVIVASHDLSVGTTISASDLGVARVRLDPSIYQRSVPATDLSSVIGKQVAEPVHADQLLVWSQVASGPVLGRGHVALTIPVSADTAVGGHIRPGVVVEILATTGRGAQDVRTAVVLPRVSVYDVGYGTGPFVSSGANASSLSTGPINSLTLAVTQQQATHLARARWVACCCVTARVSEFMGPVELPDVEVPALTSGPVPYPTS